MGELISLYSERESLGGSRYRQEFSISPIAYYDGSILKRINSDWGDSGISARPHMVSTSKLMVSVADDGDLRVHPTREENRYFEFGAPLIKVSGDWIRPGFGNRTRTGNRITWTTDHENAYLLHAGHYLKWGILLKNNYDRWSQFAMPVGLTGLTRDGNILLADGVPVMQMRKPIVYDYDNRSDVRQIAHEFVNIDSQWYALFTLPDLSGMSKPLIDPILELQPDAAAGLDTVVNSASPDNTYDTDTRLTIRGITTNGVKGLMKFDVSSIVGSIINSASLTLYADDDQSPWETVSAFRNILAANDGWLEASTWNYADGAGASDRWEGDSGNDGGADAGCSQSGIDYSASSLGSLSLGAHSAGDGIDITLTPAQVQDWLAANYGFVFYHTSGAQIDNNLQFRSSDWATAGERPKLVIEYIIAGSVCWGHVTGVTEDNTQTFTGNWTGTGTISGAGDAETVCLDATEYMESEVVDTGGNAVEILQNDYDPSGDDVVLKYRHGTTVANCEAAGWNVYSVPFTSLGFVQVRIEASP